MAATDARPVPRKNTDFRFYFALRDSSGNLVTSWSSPDSEVSKDGASFSDCTNEATEIGTTGCGYIDLTATEMNADCVILKITVSNANAKTLVIVFYPEESGDYRAESTLADGAITAAKIASDAITAAKIASDAVTEIQSGLATSSGITDIQSRLPAALVSGRMDSSVGAMASGVVTASAVATGAIDADALATDAVSEIADGILSRSVSNVESSAGEHTLCTVVLAMLENSISGTTLTIKRTDGSTTHATKTLTTNATANPITGIA